MVFLSCIFLELIALVTIIWIWIDLFRNDINGKIDHFQCGVYYQNQKIRDLELILFFIIVLLILTKHLVRFFFGSLVSQVKFNVWCLIFEPIIV